jgi:FAD/FMN-containing dehydrogenase
MSSVTLNRLGSLFPPQRLLSQIEQLAAYESDGLTAFRTGLLAPAIPETADEVITLVRFCHEEKLPFVARGSRTSLAAFLNCASIWQSLDRRFLSATLFRCSAMATLATAS